MWKKRKKKQFRKKIRCNKAALAKFVAKEETDLSLLGSKTIKQRGLDFWVSLPELSYKQDLFTMHD